MVNKLFLTALVVSGLTGSASAHPARAAFDDGLFVRQSATVSQPEMVEQTGFGGRGLGDSFMAAKPRSFENLNDGAKYEAKGQKFACGSEKSQSREVAKTGWFFLIAQIGDSLLTMAADGLKSVTHRIFGS